MGNVLKMAKQQIIQGYVSLGWSTRAINRATGVHRKTIEEYRKRILPVSPAENVPEVSTDSKSIPVQNVPKVSTDPEVPLPATNSRGVFPLRQKVFDKYGHGLTAQRIYQDLVEENGYTGSYEAVKRYVKKLRKKLPRFFERLPVIPGKEVQIDFGKAPCLVKHNGKQRRPWFFKATLSFSGHSHEELIWKQDIETFIRCMERAFHSFGGMPETVKLDNFKSAVLRACFYEPEINPIFLSFSKHYGFVPNPCAPEKPEHKGRVERDVGYTKSNALKGRIFDSLDIGNLALKHWNKRWARTRIHGSHKQQVWTRFIEGERPVLKPLPQKPFEFFKVGQRKVDVQGLVEVESCFYSVPHPYIGQYLTVHYNLEWIRVFVGYKLLVQHRPLPNKGQWFFLPGHKPAYSPLSLEQAEGWQCKKAKEIGTSCHDLVYKILCTDHPLAIRKTRGILSLVKKFESPVVEDACRYAIDHSLLSYRAVADLCDRFSQKTRKVAPVLTQEDELIRQTDFYHTLIEERTV